MGKIVVLGSLNMDLIIRMARLPAAGETMLGGDLVTALGGKGANQAVAAARLGGDVAMIGRVGADAYGQAQQVALHKEGIDTQWLLSDPSAPTGVAFILLEETGQNSIVVSPGANHRLAPDDVRATQNALESASCLVMQLETPLATVAEAASQAVQKGVRVILNPAPAQPLPASLLASVYALILNETEASQLTGLSVDRDAEIRQAGRRLLEQGLHYVVLTLGGRGAFWMTPQRSGFTPAFEVQVVDTTGAGDAFVGAFAVALAEGMGEDEAARFACSAGALATTRLGAQPSLPTRAEVTALLQGS